MSPIWADDVAYGVLPTTGMLVPMEQSPEFIVTLANPVTPQTFWIRMLSAVAKLAKLRAAIKSSGFMFRAT